jgi:AbrB family looped-hinge helix DNA binding protein
VFFQKGYKCHFGIYSIDGEMAEIVETDDSGRIVIPKSLRKELGIKRKTKFLLTKRGQGQLLLQKIDVDEMARKLEQELTGRDLDAIVDAIRKEINEKIKEHYPNLLP